MKNRSPDKSNVQAKLDEMQGYLGLKMKKEALRLAGQFLAGPRLSVEQFLKCLDVVEEFSSRSKNWRSVLDGAHGKLTRREQEQVRSRMLRFHAAKTNNNEAVLRFLPKHIDRRTDLVDLLITWQTWLEIDRMDELEKTVPVMSDAIQTAKSTEMRAWLARVYAEFWQRKATLVSEAEMAELKQDYLSQFKGVSTTDSNQNRPQQQD